MNESDSPRLKVIRSVLNGIATGKSPLIIEEMITPKAVIISVECSQEDAPKLIGKRGRIFSALELAVLLMGKKDGQGGRFLLNSPDDQSRSGPRQFVANENFDEPAFQALVSSFCGLLFETGGNVTCRPIGNHTTLVDIKISADEELPDFVQHFAAKLMPEADSIPGRDEIVGQMFDAILNAYGRSNGRNVIVEVTKLVRRESFGTRK